MASKRASLANTEPIWSPSVAFRGACGAVRARQTSRGSSKSLPRLKVNFGRLSVSVSKFRADPTLHSAARCPVFPHLKQGRSFTGTWGSGQFCSVWFSLPQFRQRMLLLPLPLPALPPFPPPVPNPTSLSLYLYPCPCLYLSSMPA